MNRTIKIDYWWKCDQIKVKFPLSFENKLAEEAEKRIFDMMLQGYTCGELIAHVFVDVQGKQTPEDGWYCRGWWTVTKGEPGIEL